MNKHYSDGNKGEVTEELMGLKWRVGHPLDFLHGGFFADSRLSTLLLLVQTTSSAVMKRVV